MRVDHPDYIKLVTEAYKKKRANNELSPLLAQSTPANIRRECANVYQERYQKKDEPALRAFFGPAEQGRKFLAVIQEFNTDKFKPLDSYLKAAGEKSINDRNLELLAWLINFQHRPFTFGMEVILSDWERFSIEISESGAGEIKTIQEFPNITKEQEEKVAETEQEEKSLAKQPEVEMQVIKKEPDKLYLENNSGGPSKNKFRNGIIIFLSLVISFGGIYIGQQKKSGETEFGNMNTGCMYWTNDHYEKLPCNEDGKGRLILPMNEEKMKRFKKITNTDTITEKSIGLIYYIKNEGEIEYFTGGGNHPIYVTRPLKVLSSYMFDKYLRKKEATEKDSLSEPNIKFVNKMNK